MKQNNSPEFIKAEVVTVAAAIILNDEKVLLARRAGGQHLAGFWEFPGGKIEAGETAEACLMRELKEELGLGIAVQRYLTENIHDYGDKKICLRGYLCTHESGHISLSVHDAAVWVDLQELNEYQIAAADKPLVTALLTFDKLN